MFLNKTITCNTKLFIPKPETLCIWKHVYKIMSITVLSWFQYNANMSNDYSNIYILFDLILYSLESTLIIVVLSLYAYVHINNACTIYMYNIYVQYTCTIYMYNIQKKIRIRKAYGSYTHVIADWFSSI